MGHAIKHFERAIELDPNCARAHAYLACVKSVPWFKDRKKERLESCMSLARKAVKLDPTEAEAHRILGGVYLVQGEHGLSGHHFERAWEANPGNSYVLAHFARYHMHVGAPDEALRCLNKARQLNPLHPSWYWEHLGIARFVKHDYAATLDAFSRIEHHAFYDRLYAAAASAFLDRPRRAKDYLDEALVRRPNLRLSNVAYAFPYRRREDLDHVLEGLRIAGMAV